MGFWDKAKSMFASKHEIVPRTTYTAVEPPITEKESFAKSYTKLHNLTIGETIMLHWLDGKPYDAPVPGFFSFNLHTNPLIAKKRLLNEGLVINAPNEVALTSLKIVDLKALLKTHDAKVSGNKADLIKRVLNEIPDEEYAKQLPRTLVASNKGKQIMEDTQLINWARTNDAFVLLPRYVSALPTADNAVTTFASIAEKIELEDLFASLPITDDITGGIGLYLYQASKFGRMASDKRWTDYYLAYVWIDYFNFENARIIVQGRHDEAGFLQSDILGKIQDGTTIDQAAISSAQGFIKETLISNLPKALNGTEVYLGNIIQSLITDSPDKAEEIRSHYVQKII
ncbi:SAP domain-containing protein [Lacticaseibacillus pabuli]|uniref:SAP domain-containing protein n=1 Tax=Lacticaseibacillus pabuli TaxID=3025672 RepID=A0ABY7WTW7_9LACO|nr:SAP domain-containing protein [Lacticaseibacillus sp. KACC 23028]WDF83595.1 SAP domain-containing protein [Lacticaseibacillus sp. KACC 23028]